MSFDVYQESQSQSNSNRPTVDFDKMNREIVEACQLQQPEVLSGVISVIVDLGTQKQPDNTYKLDDEDKGLTVEELEAKYDADMVKHFTGDQQNFKITKFANAYDNDSKSWQIMKFVKQPDRQSIVYAVDFPDIIVDKGQYFGESKPLPLRLWAGGQYWNKYIGEKGAMVVQNVIPLKVTNIGENGTKVWSMNPRSALHKMAVGAKLVNAGEAFTPQEVDKLLGQTLQFKAQVYMNKSNGKEYYTEKLSFVGGLARGQKPMELDKTYLVQFNKPNDPDAIKELRKVIVTTIQQATNYEGSVIQSELEGVRPHTVGVTPQEVPVKQENVTKQPRTKPPVVEQSQDDDDETLPF